MAQSPRERLSDLLQEVRRRSQDIACEARTQIRSGGDQGHYAQAVQTIVQQHMRSGTTREQLVGYACAAEFGFRLEPPLELTRCAGASSSFALRVLFWTVQRRMRGFTRSPRIWDASSFDDESLG